MMSSCRQIRNLDPELTGCARYYLIGSRIGKKSSLPTYNREKRKPHGAGALWELCAFGNDKHTDEQWNFSAIIDIM